MFNTGLDEGIKWVHILFYIDIQGELPKEVRDDFNL